MRPYLRILGGARLDMGAEQTPVRGRAAHRRRIALLSLLAAAPGNRLTRERIIALLWPERDSETGRKLLSESLHVVRRECGETVFVTAGDDVALSTDAVQCDLIEFRAAIRAGDFERAVALYSGPLLDGWFVADSQAFDEWASAEREMASGEYAHALEKLAAAKSAEGDRAGAGQHLATLVRLRPESAHHAIALATNLADRGDRVGGIRVLEEHARRLREDELPVEPEVLALADALRSPSRRPTPSAAPLVVETTSTSATSARPRRRAAVVAAVVAVVVLVPLATIATSGRDNIVMGTQAARINDPSRIAVLHFQHAGEDVAYLADAITGRLIDELSAVPGLRVTSRTGVLPFRDLRPMPPLDSVAEMLGVGTIIEGRVERAAEHVRVTMGLVDAATQARVGAPTVVERPLDDSLAFALADEVGHALSLLLRQQLGTELRLLGNRSGPSVAHAQELADRAEHHETSARAMMRLGRPSDLPFADSALGSADSLLILASGADPAWLGALLRRGWVARWRYRLASRDSGTAFLDRGIKLADAVLAQGPIDARALELRGTLRWERETGGRFPRLAPDRIAAAVLDLSEAIRLDSNRVTAAAALAQLLRVRATSDEDRRRAADYARLAFNRDPYLASAEGAVSQLYRAYYALQQTDSARAWCERGHIFAPGDWQFVECALALMRLNPSEASPDSAWRLVATLERIDPPSRAVAGGRPYSPVYRRLVAAAISAAHGDAARARETLAAARAEVDTDPERRVDITYDEALVLLALGERAEALAAIAEYLEHRSGYLGAVLGDPAFERFGLDSTDIVRAAAVR